MRSSHITALALWQVLAGTSIASPVQRVQVRQVQRRQDATSSAAASASAAASVSASSASVTLFQAVENQYVATPAAATETPSSGCVLATQTSSVWTDVYTYSLVAGVSYSTELVTFTDGLYCNCASGLIAGTYSSFNPEGTEYLFCATGGNTPTDQPTNAVSTSSPQASALPGDPNNPDWADVSCDYGSLPNVGGSQDPSAMWNDSGANAAWDSMYGAWTVDQSTTYFKFSNYLVNYFHGPSGTNCDVVGQGSCDGQVNCGTHLAPNGNVNSPAGYMILASMEGLHQMLEAINTAVIGAAGTIDAGAFTKAFSAITAELEYEAHIKLILDIVLIVVAVALVFAVEAILPSLPAVAAAAEAEGVTEVTATDTFNTIKTQFYLNFGAALGFAKDQLPAPDLGTATSQVEQYLDGTLNTLQSAVDSTTANIFDTPDQLLPLINNGAYWQPQGNGKIEVGTSFDVQQRIQQVVWASALPMVWSTGTQDRIAFIMTSAGIGYEGDVDNPPTGCDGWDPADTLNYDDDRTWFIQTDDSQSALDLFQQTFFCVDNVPYWLLTGHTGNDPIMTLEVPTGLDQLDGSQWGGTTPEDIIKSATTAWANAGNQNVGAIGLDPTTSDGLSSLTGTTSIGDIPGIVNIPVCSMQQAAETSGDDQNNSQGNPYWPCPASGVTGTGDGS